MSVESKRRHGPRNEKIFIRSGRERQVVQQLEEELQMFHTGEPTEAFYPLQEEVPDVSGHVLFDASSVSLERQTGRKGDVAKRRAKGINLMLESPETPRAPETLNSLVFFLQNNWDRIKRFGRTLKNKGKLNSAAERELGL